MKRRLIAVIGLVALLVSFATLGGPACAWTGGATHGCCAEPEAAPAPATDGCCGESTTTSQSPTPAPGDGCDCLHAPSAPAAITVGTPTSVLDRDADACGGFSIEVARIDLGPEHADAASTELRHPPPLFLLDCAFLT